MKENRLHIVGFVLLVIALVGCGSAPSSPVPPGGPYAYRGGVEKLLDFAWYKEHALVLSTSETLNLTLLEGSITANRPQSTQGLSYQRYNYVIREGEPDTIYVGVWSQTKDWQEVRDDGLKTCLTTPDEYTDTVEQTTRGVMIDFYSEETKSVRSTRKRTSPCWLDLAAGTTQANSEMSGVLDAMTKHFMLAQPSNPGGGQPFQKTIADFDPSKAATWVNTNVAYAGEIIVIVDNARNQCTLIVNNGSGTYRPDGKLDNLKLVAQIFENVLNPSGSSGLNVMVSDSEKKLLHAPAGPAHTNMAC